MQPIRIEVGGKTYTAGRITAAISREVVQIQKESIELAKMGKELQDDEKNLDSAMQVLDKLTALREKKSWVVCEAYGNQFTLDELEGGLTDAEIEIAVNRIMFAVNGIMTKN